MNARLAFRFTTYNNTSLIRQESVSHTVLVLYHPAHKPQSALSKGPSQTSPFVVSLGLSGHALINPSHNSTSLTETELFAPPPCERNPTPLDALSHG